MSLPPIRSARRAAGLALLIALAGAAPAAEPEPRPSGLLRTGELPSGEPPSNAPSSAPLPEAAPTGEIVTGVGPVTHLPLPRFVSLRGESANARRGPSLDQRVDWEFLLRGMPLEVTGEYGNWRRVRDVDGKGGWVHHALLSGTRTALVVGTDPAALHEKADAGARVVAVVEPGVIGRVAECLGDWCEISAGGAEGWLPRTVLWGVGATETFD